MEFSEEEIRKYDKSSLLEDIKKMPEQLLKGYELAKHIKLEEFNSITLLGMGGSSIAGFLIQKFLDGAEIPIYLKHDYHLPSHVGNESLVIATSYSGNTEETIGAYREALRKGCKVIAISTGGKMGEMAKVHRNQFIELPSGLQPRASVGYQFSALLCIMEKAGLIRNAKKELETAFKNIKPGNLASPAQKLAEKLYKKVPVIYSSERFYPVAYRWQTQLNENAKVLAISNSLSEMNHNEILGYGNAESQGNFHVVFLKDQDDEPRIQKRMSLTKEIIQKRKVDVTEIGLKGNTVLTRMLSSVLLGDLVSFYLAMVYHIDPTPVEDISWLKERIKK